MPLNLRCNLTNGPPNFSVPASSPPNSQFQNQLFSLCSFLQCGFHLCAFSKLSLNIWSHLHFTLFGRINISFVYFYFCEFFQGKKKAHGPSKDQMYNLFARNFSFWIPKLLQELSLKICCFQTVYKRFFLQCKDFFEMNLILYLTFLLIQTFPRAKKTHQARTQSIMSEDLR